MEPRPGLPKDALGVPQEGLDAAVVDPETGEERPPAHFDAAGRLTNGSEAIGEIVGSNVVDACIGQNRELFTYMGVKVLHDIVHSPFQFTPEERAAGRAPVPVNFNTGTYTATRDNVDVFLK